MRTYSYTVDRKIPVVDFAYRPPFPRLRGDVESILAVQPIYVYIYIYSISESIKIYTFRRANSEILISIRRELPPPSFRKYKSKSPMSPVASRENYLCYRCHALYIVFRYGYLFPRYLDLYRRSWLLDSNDSLFFTHPSWTNAPACIFRAHFPDLPK